jgi:hypothetical protein
VPALLASRVLTLSMSAVERARQDAANGHLRAARHRLKGYLVSRPDDLGARAELAALYRADGHLDEAGRWGYLSGATAAEKAAYEKQCAHRLTPAWTATFIRRGLRWTTSMEQTPPAVRDLLLDLDGQAAEERASWCRRAHPVRWALDRLGSVTSRQRRTKTS